MSERIQALGTAEQPPGVRGAAHAELTAAALAGVFRLQFREHDGRAQYPPREVAAGVLRGGLEWRDADPAGRVLATTDVHVSFSPYFAARAPWPVALVASAEGPSIIAHALDDLVAGDAVRLSLRLDAAGRGVVCAEAAEARVGDAASEGRAAFLRGAEGHPLRLVGDGPDAPALVRAALDAGAAHVLAPLEQVERLREAGIDDGRLVVADGLAGDAEAWPLRVDRA